MLLLLLASSSEAQAPPSNLSGSALRTWFKANYYTGKHTTLGYSDARRKMYNNIDNYNNTITCVYSGYQRSWTAGGTGTNPMPINCEHTFPQSFFGQAEPMRSDIHHLFPTYSNWNSTRSNFPFNDINDNSTQTWMYLSNSSSNIPSSNIDSYSEYASQEFEPREDHKGNIARAVFYFCTMYPSYSISQVGDPNTFYQWHLQDPVDANEMARNNKIEQYQGDRNPYIDYPGSVATAWGFSGGGGGGGGGSADLFISEYIEGSSYNKGIEIVNLTSSTVNLSNYSLKKQANGSGSWSSGLSLSGSLAPGQVYVVVHSSAATTMKNQADLTSSNSAMSFNGNDPVGLFSGSSLIDIVGTFNGGSSYFASNTTIVRKSSVSAGTTSYNASEWTSYPSNTFTYLGSHTGSGSGGGGGSADLFISEYVEGSSYNKGIEIVNLTGASVNLSGYSLKKQTNGSGNWSSALNLSGSLANGQVYVVTHSSAASGMTSQADLTTSSSVMSFNGNDPIGLFKSSSLIDVVGTFNGGSSNFAANTTLVRKSSITDGSTSYVTSEWNSYSSNTFSYLGSYGSGGREGMIATASETISIYPNPASDKFTISLETDRTMLDATLMDAQGRMVFRETLSNEAGRMQTSWNVRDLPAGMYLVRLQDKQGWQKTARVMVR